MKPYFAPNSCALASLIALEQAGAAYLFTLAQWLEADGVDTSKLPRVMDHRRRMADQPAARRALAAELA